MEKRDRGLAVIVLLLFVLAPIGMSLAISNMNGWNTTTDIDYNTTEQIVDNYPQLYVYDTNGTGSWYNAKSDIVMDNDTREVVIASTTFNDDITTPSHSCIIWRINSTFLSTKSITQLVYSWNYVGTGNLTSVTVLDTDSHIYVAESTSDVGENGTETFTPEAFQAMQMSTTEQIWIRWYFRDDTSLPITGDYFEFSVNFKTSTSLLTQNQLLQGLGAGIGITFLVFAAFVSPYWNPQTRPNPLKNRRKNKN